MPFCHSPGIQSSDRSFFAQLRRRRGVARFARRICRMDAILRISNNLTQCFACILYRPRGPFHTPLPPRPRPRGVEGWGRGEGIIVFRRWWICRRPLPASIQLYSSGSGVRWRWNSKANWRWRFPITTLPCPGVRLLPEILFLLLPSLNCLANHFFLAYGIENVNSHGSHVIILLFFFFSFSMSGFQI